MPDYPQDGRTSWCERTEVADEARLAMDLIDLAATSSDIPDQARVDDCLGVGIVSSAHEKVGLPESPRRKGAHEGPVVTPEWEWPVHVPLIPSAQEE